jgi:KDO2-lipid IV(A) lauroyltransferase
MAVNDSLIDAAYGAGWSVVRGMPERLARRQFDAIADTIWLRSGPSVLRLQHNLSRVRPDLTDRELRLLTREGVRSYFRYWCEVFQLPKLKPAQVVAKTEADSEFRIHDAMTAGNGMVLALPHMGNWDLAGAWLTAIGYPFTTVAERLKPEGLFERFVEFRESLGMEVIPLTGSERPPFQLLGERLRSGGALCLLADRDLTPTGIEVDLFGSPVRMPAGPAALAHDTGAALIPVTLYYPSRYQHGLKVHPQIPVPSSGDRDAKIRAMTQALAAVFEAEISAWPQDWHMMQRVWVDDLDSSRLSNSLDV